jgi:hypothetical protein
MPSEAAPQSIFVVSGATPPTLNIISIQLPPLKERREGIPLLIDQFVRPMKLAADQSLEDMVPRSELSEGYIIPRILDFQVAPAIAAAVAKAAMDTGVARKEQDPGEIHHRRLQYLLEGGVLGSYSI